MIEKNADLLLSTRDTVSMYTKADTGTSMERSHWLAMGPDKVSSSEIVEIGRSTISINHCSWLLLIFSQEPGEAYLTLSGSSENQTCLSYQGFFSWLYRVGS